MFNDQSKNKISFSSPVTSDEPDTVATAKQNVKKHLTRFISRGTNSSRNKSNHVMSRSTSKEGTQDAITNHKLSYIGALNA